MTQKSINLLTTPPGIMGGILLKVKQLTTEEQSKLYQKKVAWGVSKSGKDGFSISSYISSLVSDLVINLKNVESILEQARDKDYESQVLWGIYHDLIEVYPFLSLKSILVDSAYSISDSDFNDDGFSDMLDSWVMQSIMESTKKTSKEDSKDKTKSKNMSTKKEKILLTKDDITKFERGLKRNLIGQDLAIDEVIKTLKVVASGLSSRASFFFLGPTGVGKTQLAREIGNRYGAGIIKINCGEYTKSHEYAKLIGSPPGYVGHTETSFLGEKAAKSSRWVFIFDEIEKADEKLFDVLLNILDEGTLDDSSGKTLNFRDSLFFFTSNNSLQDKLKKRVGLGVSQFVTFNEIKDELKDDLKKTFKPEFLNRLDNVIIFNSLSKEDVGKIVKLQLAKYPIKISQEVLALITDKAYSEEYGARNVKRYIKNNLAPNIAEAILEKSLPKNNQPYYNIEYLNGQFEVVNTEIQDEAIEAQLEKPKRNTRRKKVPRKTT